MRAAILEMEEMFYDEVSACVQRDMSATLPLLYDPIVRFVGELDKWLS